MFLFAVVFAMRMNAAGILLPVGFDFGSAVLTVDLVKGNNCDFLSIRYYFQIYYIYFTVRVLYILENHWVHLVLVHTAAFPRLCCIFVQYVLTFAPC